MLKSLGRQIEESETTFDYVDEISVHEETMKTPLAQYTVDHFDSFIGRQLKFAVGDLMRYIRVSMEALRKEYKLFVKGVVLNCSSAHSRVKINTTLVIDPNRTLYFDNDHRFVPLTKKATSIKTYVRYIRTYIFVKY